MIARLLPAEQKLILDLTEDFFRCTLSRYDQALRKLITELQVSGHIDDRRIIAVPLTKPEDIGKVKSGPLALYLFKTEIRRRSSDYGLAFSTWDRPDLVAENHPDRENSTILFVDDFVGSGEAAIGAVQHFADKWKVDSDRLVVAALVAQQQAIDALVGIGAPCIAGVIRNKGITDSTRISDKPTAMALMQQIESRLKVSAKNRLGFNQSEALVCMIRCPNNTFPVYWSSKIINDRAWPAPFER